ncbi:MAG: hypothetical protein GYA24_21755 [Candidatus Lokiarchaeota archaeon]|nr:hypothetical protein [Candidatus Lokiarchaeota archaeon]
MNSVSLAGWLAAGCDGFGAAVSCLNEIAGMGNPHFWHTVSRLPRAMNCAPHEGQITIDMRVSLHSLPRIC